MITACGFCGNGAKRSIITLRGGGGNRLPGTIITFLSNAGGGCDGLSRRTKGGGVCGRGGCCRNIIGGAFGGRNLNNYFMIIRQTILRLKFYINIIRFFFFNNNITMGSRWWRF